MALLDRLLVPLSPAAALRRAVRLTEQGNIKQAFPLLTRAALAGIAEAEYRVGRCYLEGAGVPPSRTEGARWLERAANQGYVEAQAQLATLAIHGLTASADNGHAARLFAAAEATQPDFRVAPPMVRRCSATS
jgi:TPR repeat protein